MKIAKPDLNKFKDISKKNLKIFILSAIFIPLLALLFYYIFPGNYFSSFKIQLKAEYSGLVEETDTKKIIAQALTNTNIFSENEISYFKSNFEVVDEGRNLFRINAQDTSNSRLQYHVKKSCDNLRDMLGKIPKTQIPIELKRLETLIDSDNKEKARLEDKLSSIDEESSEKTNKLYEKEIIEIEDQIEPKKNQLRIIESKINSFKSKDPKVKIFKSKAQKLNAELNVLLDKKNDILQKLESSAESEEGIKLTLQKLVNLEENIEKNLKKLSLIASINSNIQTENITLPYLYSVNVIEPPAKSKKIFMLSALRKSLLIGFLISLLFIAGFFFYHLSFNPIISSVEELEEFSGLPVIGAIHEIKKSL